MECSADTRNIHWRSWGCTESSQMVPRPHGLLTEVDRKSQWRTESWRKVPRPHVRLTEGLSATQKVEEQCCGRTESWRKVTSPHRKLRKVPRPHWKLMESPTDTRKVNWSWLKVRQPQIILTTLERMRRKLSVVDGKSLCHTESWQKVPLTHKSWLMVPGTHKQLTKCPAVVRKFDRRSLVCTECWQKVSWLHRKLKQLYGKSCRCTEGSG